MKINRKNKEFLRQVYSTHPSIIHPSGDDNLLILIKNYLKSKIYLKPGDNLEEKFIEIDKSLNAYVRKLAVSNTGISNQCTFPIYKELALYTTISNTMMVKHMTNVVLRQLPIVAIGAQITNIYLNLVHGVTISDEMSFDIDDIPVIITSNNRIILCH